MSAAESIHFNLVGVFERSRLAGQGPRTFTEAAAMGAEGAGQGNWTNWELYQSARYFADKTIYYIDDTLTVSLR